jgi:predicted nucleic acid-binding protein
LSSHEKAIELAQRFNLSFYDANIVASALFANSPILWSVDMQNGLQLEGLQIQNPFAPITQV